MPCANNALCSVPRAPPEALLGVPVFWAMPFLRALPCELPIGRDGRAVFFPNWPFGGIVVLGGFESCLSSSSSRAWRSVGDGGARTGCWGTRLFCDARKSRQVLQSARKRWQMDVFRDAVRERQKQCSWSGSVEGCSALSRIPAAALGDSRNEGGWPRWWCGWDGHGIVRRILGSRSAQIRYDKMNHPDLLRNLHRLPKCVLRACLPGQLVCPPPAVLSTVAYDLELELVTNPPTHSAPAIS